MGIDLKNFLPGICGIVFGAWLLRETSLLDVELAAHVGGGMNAAGYPRMLALGIIGLSIVLVGQAIFHQSKRITSTDENSDNQSAYKKATIAYIGLILYTLLLIPVGYLIMTPILLSLVMILVDERRWVFVVTVSIVLTLSLYMVSYYAFHIVLPEGVFRYLSS